MEIIRRCEHGDNGQGHRSWSLKILLSFFTSSSGITSFWMLNGGDENGMLLVERVYERLRLLRLVA